MSCMEGDLLNTGKFIYSEKVKLNYTSTESFCARLGLQVPMPQSIEENNQQEFWNNVFWLAVKRGHFKIHLQINEILMQKGMFLTFWLRTKNDYFNVKSEMTENPVFKQQIKTEFVQGQDELISGGFPKLSIFRTHVWNYVRVWATLI